LRSLYLLRELLDPAWHFSCRDLLHFKAISQTINRRFISSLISGYGRRFKPRLHARTHSRTHTHQILYELVGFSAVSVGTCVMLNSFERLSKLEKDLNE